MKMNEIMEVLQNPKAKIFMSSDGREIWLNGRCYGSISRPQMQKAIAANPAFEQRKTWEPSDCG